LVRVPTLLACARTDMLVQYFDQVQALMPNAQPLLTPGTASPAALAETVGLFTVFLDRG
jgi:hypothetical protein